jgi:uncharacterized protein YgbK (DUF1537 family)
MTLVEMLCTQPPVKKIPEARSVIRKDLIASGRRLVVIDDDPTGVQAIQNVKVLMKWTTDVIRNALSSANPVFFISTNSRGLGPVEARIVSPEVGRNLREASRLENIPLLLASRSDSTLRGHFPCELEALTSGMGLEPDGIIIAPVFLEAGRYTISDTQWVEQDGELIPVNQTEFARDPLFGFKNSDLKAWVAEKMHGTVRVEDVLSISLDLIRRGGPEAVATMLLQAENRKPIIVNAACYEDLEVMVLGLLQAESHGKIFVYRCAASFIKARGGFEDRPLLSPLELAAGQGPGLIVAGSYVEKTSRQLRQLLDSGLAEGVELSVPDLHEQDSRQREIQKESEIINRKLSLGITTVLYSSREVRLTSTEAFLEIGRIIMVSLCEVIRRITIPPAYLIAKGGITSIEVARQALQVEEALAIGQIINGVPVLRFGPESRWPDIPFVVFPGNVGDDSALLRAVRTLSG